MLTPGSSSLSAVLTGPIRRIRLRLPPVSLRASLVLAAVAFALIAALAFAGLIRSTQRLKSDSNRRAQSELAIAQAGDTLTLVLDLETGERGFVATGKQDFLQPWRQARGKLPAATARLRSLVTRDPALERIATQIETSASAYVRDWTNPVIELGLRNPSAARQRVATGEGMARVDAIRRMFVRFTSGERTLTLAHTAAANSAASSAIVFGIAGLAGTLVILGMLAFVLAGAVVRPLARIGVAADRIARGDLTVRVRPRGPRELEAIGMSFNAMAGSLEHGRHELLEARRRAEEASHAKSAFLSRMSHELRTPLNAIIGFGQLLELDVIDEQQRQSVDHILKAGRHLLELINEVLEISRIEAGELALSSEPVAIVHAVREALAMVAPLATNLELKLDVETNGLADDLHVFADRQRLSQVMLNLLSNAIKYNRRGGSVHVSFEQVGEARVRTAITDTGIGLEPGQLPRMFEPFERLGAESRAIDGTGLGLALSQRLVSAMGGTIEVVSEPGKGSTFTVELELAHAPRGGESTADPADGLEEMARRPDAMRHRVLYIEDNLSNLKLVERIVRRQPSVELMSAMQGTLGLDLAREHQPDLIVLDLHLPDMRGTEVLRRLKAEESTKQIPVVILSAEARSHEIDHLLALGAADYLTKPLDVRHFLSVIAANLDLAPEEIS
jgi:signal transduction histidine kinase/ActR/RegA family two-component response regulator